MGDQKNFVAVPVYAVDFDNGHKFGQMYELNEVTVGGDMIQHGRFRTLDECNDAVVFLRQEPIKL